MQENVEILYIWFDEFGGRNKPELTVAGGQPRKHKLQNMKVGF